MIKPKYLIWRRVRYPFIVFRSRWPVEPIYSLPGGNLCFVDQVGWRNWSGFAFRAGHWVLWVYFRRGTLI